MLNLLFASLHTHTYIYLSIYLNDASHARRSRRRASLRAAELPVVVAAYCRAAWLALVLVAQNYRVSSAIAVKPFKLPVD